MADEYKVVEVTSSEVIEVEESGDNLLSITTLCPDLVDVETVTGTIIKEVPIEGIPYEGEYKIIPKVTEQHLNTMGKTMKDDVTIYKIPKYETSNNSGTTIIIG